MPVVQATDVELNSVIRLLSEARHWQSERGVDVWQEFDPAQISKDVSEGRVFIAKAAGAICGSVTLVEADPLVWGGDDGSALYIHKLAASRQPHCRGIGAQLLRWAQGVARQRGKTRLRLDTWDGNRKMREYYENQGFRHVRDEFFPLDSPLPADYRGTWKSLYQLDL